MPTLRHVGSELIHESGLRAQGENIRQPLPAVTPEAPPSVAPDSRPTFSYDLYCDKQGHFTYDGAALDLVKRLSHLQRVYADAARGETRANQLIHELEYGFQQAGIAAADRTAALGCRVLPEFQSDCRPPNWEFLDQFLGDTPESIRLREVLAEAYARRAQQLSVRNDIIVAGVNLLLAGSMAKAVLARAGAVEVRTTAQQPLASEVKSPAAALENSGPIARSLGAASRAEMLAKRLGLNLKSPTSRQVLNSLDMKVTDFIGKYRKGSIRSKFPSEYLEKTVEEALLEGGSTVRKLLTDSRFLK